MAHALRSGLRNGGLRRGGLHAGLEGGSIFNIASLDLNFAKYKNIGSLVTFTRASSGTFVGSDGVLRTAVTNLSLRSEKLDEAGQWSVIGSGATLTATTDVAAPNGAMTAWTLTSSGAAAQIQQAPTGISGATYTGSFYIRRRSGTGTVNIRVSENINTPLVGVTSEWQRFSFTATSTSTTIRLGVNLSGIADAVDLWGAQLEQSATVGEYIPTTSVINSAPRFDHNPTTGESLGLLVEEARTNVLLNSATLSTQSVTVAAAANTLSFYGTGTVTLTGVSTAGPLVGTGANNRVSLTFTPTVGVLILTVSGSVTNAQLEAGAFPTSYIPTTTATVTRAADVASIGSGSAFTSWMTSFDENTFFIEYNKPPALTTQGYLIEGHESSTLRGLSAGLEPGQVPRITIRHGSSRHDTVGTMAAYLTGTNRIAAGTSASGSASASNGVIYTGGTTTQSDWTARSAISIGRRGAFNTNFANTPIRRLTFWPTRLGGEVLQRITQP